MYAYLLVTLDTKGTEAQFTRERIEATGIDVRVIDVGSLGTPAATADISREQVFMAAGTSLAAVQSVGDRGAAVTAAARGAAAIMQDLFRQGKVAGVMALGGSAGTTIGCAAMRALPLGVPKVMVSTLASGQVRHYVGDKDIAMFNSIVDIAGINRISRLVLTNAAHALVGMLSFGGGAPQAADKPLVAASMFGVTTPCVNRARGVLEAAGYEVLVFHATGNGGQALESLVGDGLIAGVLDITTTELADELVGGVLSAGADRLTAAGRRGVPQVISVGAVDMVNFHAWETVPAEFRSRLLHRHNANVTLMRTTIEENARIGAEIGRKAAAAQGPTAILLPKQGVSALDKAGQPFDDPAARESLFTAIRAASGAASIEELDAHINDDAFAVAAAERLLAFMGAERRR